MVKEYEEKKVFSLKKMHAQQFSLHPSKKKEYLVQARRSSRPFGNVIILYIYFSSYISLTYAVSPGAEELRGLMKPKLVNTWISGTGDKSALIRLQ